MKSGFNKRGSVQDAFYIAVFMAVIPIALIMAFLIYTNLNDALQETVTLPTEIQETQDEFSSKFPKMLDSLFIFVLVGSYMATFILAFFIDTHPVFFIMTALLFTVTIVVVPFMMNAYSDFAASDQIVTTVSSFPITNYIMNHYLQFTIVMWGLIGVGLYSKRVAL